MRLGLLPISGNLASSTMKLPSINTITLFIPALLINQLSAVDPNPSLAVYFVNMDVVHTRALTALEVVTIMTSILITSCKAYAYSASGSSTLNNLLRSRAVYYTVLIRCYPCVGRSGAMIKDRVLRTAARHGGAVLLGSSMVTATRTSKASPGSIISKMMQHNYLQVLISLCMDRRDGGTSRD